jgi:hypothetical protein
MKRENGIVVYATEEARKKWEGKELPCRKGKSACPSCEIEAMKKKAAENDYINEEKEE